MRIRRSTLTLLVSLLSGASPAAAVTVTRGPYLQMPTPSSVIVRWRTDVATNSRVKFGNAPGSLTSMMDDVTSTTEHVVQVSGLAADSPYYYSVGSAGGALLGDDPAYYFRTFPSPGPARPTRIWAFGDAGFVGANLNAVRDAYATFTGGTPTDLWLLLGDNAYILATDADYQGAVFNTHQDLLRRVAPWPTFGNHEAFSSNSLTGTGPYFDMFSLPTGGEAGGVPSGTEAYYSFDFANIHVIVLDGHATPTATGQPMNTWLQADLAATTADWVIAAWHQPPYSKGLLHDSDVEAREIEMRQNILPILDANGVDLVLNGHSHDYERSHLLDGHYGLSTTLTAAMVLDGGDGRPAGDGPYRKAIIGTAPHEGAVYVVAGSGSEVRTATLNHPAMEIGLLKLGSLVLDVTGDTLDATFVQSDGQIGDSFRIVKGHGGSPTNPCGVAPITGCVASAQGSLVIRKSPVDSSRDTVAYRWKQGALVAGDVGSPPTQDYAFCVYDALGKKLGGTVLPGAGWRMRRPNFFTYLDRTGVNGPIRGVQIAVVDPLRSQLWAGGRGAGLGLLGTLSVLPVTAQVMNLDNGKCWQTTFTSAVQNAYRFSARLP
jgi:hypothetical protein